MSIFRLEVRKPGGGGAQGTAWQLGPDLVVTAFHVVGEAGKWMHEGIIGVTYVLIVSDGEPRDLTPLAFDAGADIALLQVASPLTTSCLPVSNEQVKRGAIWSAAGFPELLSRSSSGVTDRPFHLTGSVAASHAYGAKDDLQLTVNEGTSVSWEGTSGSAVCVGDRVVGTLTEEVSYANTLKAAGIAPLRKILQRIERDVRFSNPDSELQSQTQFLAVVEMTRADGKLLDRPNPPAIGELAVWSFLKNHDRFESGIGSWLLLWAASRGLHQIVVRLLKAGCRPDWRVDESPAEFDIREDEIAYFWPGGTALHAAARRGSIPVIRQLIDAGASVGARDRNNSTPLHVAAALREDPLRLMLLRASALDRKFGELPPETDDDLALQAVQLLLSKGADPALSDASAQTPAGLAADYPEMLALILSRTKIGTQPALWIATSRMSQESIDLLVEHGADLNRPDSEGNILLRQAVLRFDYLKDKAYQKRVAELVEHLLESGANVRLRDSDKETALHQAVRIDASRIVESLLRRGADPNTQSDRGGETPLFSALSGDVARQLIDAGADPKIVDHFGFTALDHAVILGRANVAEAMKDLGITLAEMTPALRSIRTGEDLSLLSEIDAAHLMSARDLDGDPIVFWAVRMLNAKATRFLLDHGIPVDARNSDGLTLLAQALRSAAWFTDRADTLDEIVALLRERGADPCDDGQSFHCCFSGFQWWRNEKIAPWILKNAMPSLRDKNRETPLMRAVVYGMPAQVQSFLRQGADVDAIDHLGRSALFHRIQFYNSEEDLLKASLLLKAGADLNLQDGSGMTPLMTAAASGCEVMTRWLIENGADLHPRDQSGRNAYDWALQKTRLPDLINTLRV